MEILNTTTVYNEFVGVLALLLLLIAIFCFVAGIVFLVKTDWKSAFECFLIALGFSLLFLLVINWFSSTEKIKHEVLITDISEFDTSKYEIIEQRGRIFVVEEKEVDH